MHKTYVSESTRKELIDLGVMTSTLADYIDQRIEDKIKDFESNELAEVQNQLDNEIVQLKELVQELQRDVVNLYV